MGTTRKKFIKNIIGGLAILPTLTTQNLLLHKIKQDMMTKNQTYTLKNVRLETGFEYDQDEVIGTKTALFTIEISNGKINKIYNNKADLNCIDAQGFLMLPSFKDMHIHLDKTIYGDKWKATNRRGDIKTMIALEQQILPEILKNSTFKAEKLIELLQSKGTNFARSHVNIEPTSQLNSLNNLFLALENKKDSFGSELVIFPQHGLFYTDSLSLMKEAVQMDVDFIGGLDPTTVDGNLYKTIDATVQLALDNNKGIDIHLHETGETGLKTIEYLKDKVNENPVLKGKTFISHSFVLAKLDSKTLQDTAEKLAEAQIGIVSTIPIGKLTMPIPLLIKNGVNVMVGNDSIVDHWETTGTGSVLQKANLAAQLYGLESEFELSRLLKLATAGISPLNDNGVQQWPKVGEKANFVLVDASCSAETVARIPTIQSMAYEGNILY